MTKKVYDQAEIDRLVQEKLKEYAQDRIAKIEMKYGNTYISFGVKDYITEQYVALLQKLFKLMNEEFSTYIPFTYKENFYLILEGENEERTRFVQKFIDNGYKLSWK